MKDRVVVVFLNDLLYDIPIRALRFHHPPPGKERVDNENAIPCARYLNFHLVLAFSANIAPVGAHSLAPPSIVITVDITADEFLTTGGTGCSLREAVYSANYADYGGCARSGSTGRLTVRVPAGYYTLTRHGAGENFAQTGDLDILTGMDILGDGIGITIIDGDDADRIFDVLAFDLATVTISDVSVYDGYSGSGLGGAIKNTSNLHLTRVRLDGNHTDTSGGAIYHKSTTDPASPPARSGACH